MVHLSLGYVALIEEAELSSKEKVIKHSRGRNINRIVTKLNIHVGFIKIQDLCKTLAMWHK